MFHTHQKLSARIGELSEHRFRDKLPIESLKFQLDAQGANGARPPSGGEWTEFKAGETWKADDAYAWLTADVAVPQAWDRRKILGIFRFSRSGGTFDQAFEALLYVNGVAYQGADHNHQEVVLPDGLAGTTVSLCFRLWSGITGRKHELVRVELCRLDEETEDLYFTALVAVESAKAMNEACPEKTLVLTAVDRAFRALDWSKPGSTAFYDSVKKANAIMQSGLSAMGKNHGATLSCVGQTHIDIEWLWRLKHTREKAARSFSTTLRLMEQYPEFTFFQSQPALYAFLKSDYPEIYEQIRAGIEDGRWEADGAMWVEADGNLPSGESFVRQILLVTRFLREEFGVECTVLWLLDTFGYSWALPQILKKSGIQSFYTQKLAWNQYNKFPHDIFRWRGIDGSEVTSYVRTEPKLDDLNLYQKITPMLVQKSWEVFPDKELNQDVLFLYGHGDGGGGVNRDMLEMRRRLDKMPGMPNVRMERIDKYFERLSNRLAETDCYVPTWDGELYLEYHRGTYTSQAHIKRANRKMELLYREAEWLAVYACIVNDAWGRYPSEELTNGWKLLLLKQFHDVIPGTSIADVYADSRIDHATAEKIALSALQKAAESLASTQDDSTVTVLNSAPWTRAGLLPLPADTASCAGWTDASGTPRDTQLRDNIRWVRVTDLPSMGLGELRRDPSATPGAPSSFKQLPLGLETPFYLLTWNESGQLTRLYDRQAGREVLAEGMVANELQVFEDKPIAWDAWDIDVFYQQKMRRITNLKSMTVTEMGPLFAVMHFEWVYQDSTISQSMILYAHSRRIDFETTVDWQERQMLLKVAFPVAIRANEATYDIQFGNVKRPTHWNTSWDYARFETVAHQWVDLSEHGYGVSLLNDCKYGHDVKDNVLRLSLLRSPNYPDNQADLGRHVFTYALLPHAGDWREAGTVREAWDLNNPITIIPGSPITPVRALFRLSVDNVMIDAVKKAEDHNLVIVRLHEFTGARGPVELTSDLPVEWWRECDLMERPIGEQVDQPSIRFHVKPYEIRTFWVKMGKWPGKNNTLPS
jgi:alpha-mannosidase